MEKLFAWLVLGILSLYALQFTAMFLSMQVYAESVMEGIVYFKSANELGYVGAAGCVIENVFWNINAALVQCTARASNTLRSMGINVAPNINISISTTLTSLKILGPVNRVMEASNWLSNVSFAWSWAVSRVGADLVWRYFNATGSNVTIAVLDTGIDPTHPLIAGKLSGWIEFDRKGRPVCSNPHDTYGHGTWVASIAAGGDGKRYVFGVAPSARIIAALVLPAGFGTAAQVLAGLNWVLKPVDCRGNPINVGRVAVVSMSFGESGNYSNVFLPAVAKLIDSGIIPVAAIGNDGPYTSSNPGNIWGVIGVGATDYDDELAWFSSFEEVEWPEPPATWPLGQYPKNYTKPDIVAPGVDVPGAWPGGLLAIGSGTSASTPIVAAIAGVVSQILYEEGLRGSQLVSQVRNILMESAEGLPFTGAGHGLVNAFKAVAEALGYRVSDFTISVYPSSATPLSTVRLAAKGLYTATTLSMYIAGVEVFRGGYSPGAVVEAVVPPTHYSGNEVFAVGLRGNTIYYAKTLLYVDPALYVKEVNVTAGMGLSIAASGVGIGDLITLNLGNSILSLDISDLRGSYQATLVTPYAASGWYNITLYDFSNPTITLSKQIYIATPRPVEEVKYVEERYTEVRYSLLPVIVKVSDYYVSGVDGYIDVSSPLNITIETLSIESIVKGNAQIRLVNITTLPSGIHRIWIKPELLNTTEAEVIAKLRLNINNTPVNYPIALNIIAKKPEETIASSISKEVDTAIKNIEKAMLSLNNTASKIISNVSAKTEELAKNISQVKTQINSINNTAENYYSTISKEINEMKNRTQQLTWATIATIALSITSIIIALTRIKQSRYK